MPRHELSNKRPSVLGPLFRRLAEPGEVFADWTRHLDRDWTWYCPVCALVVLMIEEKSDNSPATSWTVTRRLATRHEDRPWGWRITCHSDGAFSVVGARNDPHDSFLERRVSQDELVNWIVRVFEQHYSEQDHPARVAV